jgi:type IV secretion system protein VirD4
MSFPFFRHGEVIGSAAPDALYLGRYRDPKTGKLGPKIQIPGSESVVICGRNRVGKDTGIAIPNALQRRGLSTAWWDIRGEASAISLPYRRSLGPAWIDNPFGELVSLPGYADLRSNGVNLLKSRDLDPANPLCFDYVCALVEPMIPAEGDHQPFFPMSGQSLYASIAKQELKEAKRDGRDPSLVRVRMKATEADEFDPETGEAIKGIQAQARRMLTEGDPQICSLIGGFAGKDTDAARDVVATGAAHTRWLLSTAITENEKAAQIDFAQLGQIPTSLYICLPHNMVKTHAAYLRMVATAILQPLFAAHNKVPVCLWLNEFAAMGRVPAIDSALGLVAGSGAGIQIVVVVQSLVQLAQHYDRGWEAFLSQAGAIVLVGPAGDKFTADYLSARSGETTIVQPHAGWSLNSGGTGLSAGDAFTRRPYLMPSDLYGIPPGQGYIWLAGLADPIPAAFPPYFTDPVLKRRARANPYYRG